MVFLWAGSALAQVPAPASKPGVAGQQATEALPPQPPPPPAAEPRPVPTPRSQPALGPAPTQPAPAAAPAPAAPPPLRAPAPSLEPPAAAKPIPDDFVLRASPWVDFALVSFYMADRASNFLNLGVQVGGYAFDRLRVSARFVAPLDPVNDDLSYYSSGTQDGSGAFRHVPTRSMSMMYGASVGLLITNSKTFVFGPSVELQRTDVGAYGTTLAFGLPFEWTTQRNLRVGFELAIGHSFGGSVREVCDTFSSPPASCGSRTVDRPSGSAVLFQYSMGWSLGSL